MLQDLVDSVLARRIFHALRAEQLAAKYGDKLADPATRALVKPELQWILGFAISWRGLVVSACFSISLRHLRLRSFRKPDISVSGHFLVLLGSGSKEHSAGARARHPGARRGGSWGASTAAVAGAGAFWLELSNGFRTMYQFMSVCINIIGDAYMIVNACKCKRMHTYDWITRTGTKVALSEKLQLASIFKICGTFQNFWYGYMAIMA